MRKGRDECILWAEACDKVPYKLDNQCQPEKKTKLDEMVNTMTYFHYYLKWKYVHDTKWTRILVQLDMVFQHYATAKQYNTVPLVHSLH